jgi:uroporphyrin-III C-methyltransferase
MKVQLVGAGPGAADLMTLRAAKALSEAEAVLYDALVCGEVLAMAPARSLRICTGKRAGKTSMKQATINRLVLRLARRGLRVVRLKGGDPSVFGRCGEERDFLEAHGVEVEVVPGVTAASAAAAQFAFPLTHRGEARRLMIATARTLDGAVVDGGWREAADAETTVALYMAGQAASEVAARLIAEGRSPTTPALAVENAGRPEARLVRCDLTGLPQAVADAAFDGPVLLLVGAVAAHARKTGSLPRNEDALPARACP